MSTLVPAWGRVHRGVVWHVLTADAASDWPVMRVRPGAWCGIDDEFAELTELRPPRGARPCPRCCAALREYARLVSVTHDEAIARNLELDLDDARPVEDNDLLAALPAGAAEGGA